MKKSLRKVVVSPTKPVISNVNINLSSKKSREPMSGPFLKSFDDRRSQSIYRQNKYSLKELFENTPCFEVPPMNFSNASNQASKQSGKLYKAIAKAVLSPQAEKSRFFWHKLNSGDALQRSDFRYKEESKFPMLFRQREQHHDQTFGLTFVSDF